MTVWEKKMAKSNKPKIDMFAYENKAMQEGAVHIAGMDEAGRGPLAGPVVVASVIMPLEPEFRIAGVNDSKKLSEKKRDEFYLQIMQLAKSVSVVSIGEKTIDKINILNATKQGMQESIRGLSLKPDIVLIDAVKLPLPVRSWSIVKGDGLSYSIACASIVAKVTRDNLMREYDLEYPEYNFAQHKGYGTKKHSEKLKEIGPCAIHRASFITHFVK